RWYPARRSLALPTAYCLKISRVPHSLKRNPRSRTKDENDDENDKQPRTTRQALFPLLLTSGFSAFLIPIHQLTHVPVSATRLSLIQTGRGQVVSLWESHYSHPYLIREDRVRLSETPCR